MNARSPFPIPTLLAPGRRPRAGRKPIRAVLLAAAILAGGAGIAGDVSAEDRSINIYSYRQEFLLQPLLDAFKADTGIGAKVVYLQAGALERLAAEGANSPADVVLTSDIAQMVDVAEAGLLRPIASAKLAANVPAHYRDPDGRWFGLTTRGRVIYASKDRVKPGAITTYEDLADPKWQGRVCTRSGKHPYNVSLLASIIAHKGEAAAEAWARGLKANLARKPQGNDRGQVKAVKDGVCDVALGNTYYMGLMATNEKEPEQKEWAAAVRIVFPNQPDEADAKDPLRVRGTHVNASAGAVTKNAPRAADAQRFLEFLSDTGAQAIYAGQDFEYPVKAGTPLHPLVASWGAFKADAVNLDGVARLRDLAVKIMDRVAFDL
jgi:iron(III) transport system substrate-binding protein